ncbi:MAG TPA: hypothetical protein VJR23_04465 [Candidatus Acidoferrales bacterium]|nr:hypothetical protein [Candidatus Acidoferrales bacterium]
MGLGARGRERFRAVFQFGHQRRNELRNFAESRSGQEWDAPFEFKMFQLLARAMPRKFAAHVLIHSNRRRMQIAILLRLNERKGESHDFWHNDVIGGGIERLAE